MEPIFVLLSEIGKLITYQNFLLFSLSSIAGIIIGALPGLTASMGIALLTGLTYGADTKTAFIMLLSIYVGAIYGGSISAVLIGIPGTGSAAATVLDGNKLARKGHGGLALGLATVASFFGTVFGIFCLTAFTPLLQRISLSFTSAEYTLLAIFGITICGSLSSAGEPIKGWIAGFLGILISLIGFDGIYAHPRFTFGVVGLLGGIALVPAMIGLFGVPAIFTELAHSGEKVEIAGLGKKQKVGIFTMLKNHYGLVLRSGAIGTFIGAIPGVGEDVAAWMSYDIAKKTSKSPEEFGKGSIEAVMAAETANNSAIGGALIPLLSLGVPGSGPAAVLLGALMLHNVHVGPMLPIQHPNFILEMSAILLVAALCMRIFGYFICQVAPKVLSVPAFILMPIVGTLAVIGSYSVYVNVFDLYVMFFIGLFGFALERLKYPAAPVVIGIILGPMADSNFRRTMMSSLGDMSPFFTRPICIVLLLLLTYSMLSQFAFFRYIRQSLIARLRRNSQIS